MYTFLPLNFTVIENQWILGSPKETTTLSKNQPQQFLTNNESTFKWATTPKPDATFNGVVKPQNWCRTHTHTHERPLWPNSAHSTRARQLCHLVRFKAAVSPERPSRRSRSTLAERGRGRASGAVFGEGGLAACCSLFPISENRVKVKSDLVTQKCCLLLCLG